MPKIIVSDSSGEREVPLDAGEITIGRVASQNDVAINVPEASRRHCRIVREDDAWFVEDLGSSNGTRVNGRRVTKFELQDGDEIQVGLARLRFLESDAVVPAVEGDDDEVELEISLDDDAALVFLNTDRQQERVPLSGRVTIGRKSTNTVVLKEKGVSGNHAEIVHQDGEWIVRDLGSTNGTLVDGVPVAEAPLSPGTRVRIGVCEFVFAFGEDDGGDLVATVTMEESPLDDEVFAISEANMRRKQRTSLILTMVFLAVVVGCAAFWIMQGGEASRRVVTIESVPGNLIGIGAGFEPLEEADDTDEYLVTESDAVDFEEVTTRRRSGQYGLEITAAGGDAYIVFSKPIKNVSAADRIEVAGWFVTNRLSGLAGLTLAWFDEEGRPISRSHVNAPPGLSSWTRVVGTLKPPYGTDHARLAIGLHEASGKVWVDDVSAVKRREGAEGALAAHDFTVMLEPTATLVLSRDGEEVLWAAGFWDTSGDRPRPLAEYVYGTTETDADAVRFRGASIGGATVEASVGLDETGVVWGGRVSGGEGRALGMIVDPEEGLVTVAGDEGVRHAGDFEREAVTEVVIAAGHRAVRLEFGTPTRVRMVTTRRQSVLLVPLADGENEGSFSLGVQLDFSKEQAEVAKLHERAQRADVVEKRYGEAMRLYSEIANRYSFRKDLADQAQRRYAELERQGEAFVRDLEERVDDTIFFQTFHYDFETLQTEATAARRTYEGAEIAERVEKQAERLKRARDEAEGAYRRRRAENHLARGLDLMTPGRSAPALARGFFLSVLLLDPDGAAAEKARDQLREIDQLLGSGGN